MSYVVLNGKRSTLIKGLLISSLPPITKPLMRTDVETIDGRDGDIVTKLGYAAYDKVITIGLAGDYDVDQVIEYFDSEGEVIFSNEPDKFYRYQILEAIDFERLLRFKTAEVTFHVQPFKYSAVDEVVKPPEFYFPTPFEASYNGTVVFDGDRYVFDITTTTALTLELPCLEFTLRSYGQYKMIVAPDGLSACSATLAGRSLTLTGLNVSSFQQYEEVTDDMLVFEIPASTTVKGTLEVHLFKSTYSQQTHAESLKILSQGNNISKPRVIVYGKGDVTLNLDGKDVVVLDLSSYTEASITLNSETLNAYGHDGLHNRLVTGDLRDLRFKPGRHVLQWSSQNGSVAGCAIEEYSRWI